MRLALSVLVVALAAAWWAVSGAQLWAQDRCLDAGGAGDEGACVGAR